MVKTDATSEMQFFTVLARQGSLSAAGRELAIMPPAVTRRLAQMEQRLGVRLLNRTTHRFSLTSEGALYLEQAQRILADIREMEESVASHRAAPKGLLRVKATRGFGRTTSAPMVSAFARA